MTDWPVHGRIDGPIVMIGFGSIGKGTLPLIERHFAFDKKRMVIVDPNDSDRALAQKHGVRFIKAAVTRENYRELLTPLLTEGGGRGFCVNLSVDTSSVAIMELCREIGALYIDTVAEPWPGFYFDKSMSTERAHKLCVARTRARSAPPRARRSDRRVVLRRQSRHGVVVRQARAAEPRRRSWRHASRPAHEGGVGQARAAPRREGNPHRRARHAAVEEAQAHAGVRQHVVGRRLSFGRRAAGGTGLGHARNLDARERGRAFDGLRRGDLSQAAGRQHARALVDADGTGAIRIPRHAQRGDLDLRLPHRA